VRGGCFPAQAGLSSKRGWGRGGGGGGGGGRWVGPPPAGKKNGAFTKGRGHRGGRAALNLIGFRANRPLIRARIGPSRGGGVGGPRAVQIGNRRAGDGKMSSGGRGFVVHQAVGGGERGPFRAAFFSDAKMICDLHHQRRV